MLFGHGSPLLTSLLGCGDVLTKVGQDSGKLTILKMQDGGPEGVHGLPFR